MRSSVILSALSVFAVTSAQLSPSTNAVVVTDNPAGVTYVATLPESGQLHGSISGVASSNGTGVTFTVSFRGLPTSGGPFGTFIHSVYSSKMALTHGPFLGYHIHDKPVPSNGSCTATLAHLDPFKRGEDPPCDPNDPKTCQVGDLAGKHGKMGADPFEASYVDLYASTKSGNPAFFGDRSIVIHFANKTRIACANFALKTTNGTTTPTTSGSTPTGPTKSPTSSSGAAAGAFVPMSVFFSGLLAALML
ncbi:hypothetical protein FGG08_006717 [Glutinoglossum americanum]|uniref:superoxide dismutase n=1 Tax=Glutinoglossum americanum TaxID=1670608 RepID=A0A9P8I2X0_9PEZI|nr:hypothetical protein FGG08_006717 [Glutinoglossum americanum]